MTAFCDISVKSFFCLILLQTLNYIVIVNQDRFLSEVDMRNAIKIPQLVFI